ncbi:MAG: septal ring lytic transglycosylase RlpA family protein [Bernardetiaceae bacterium]|nr:septal ring lytic transglycosylase RlpA family protein [Bernardetiaceae bacterium]
MLALSSCKSGITLTKQSKNKPHKEQKANTKTEKDTPNKKNKPEEQAPKVVSTQEGQASYYGDKYHGRPTASGEKYNKTQLTAAHPKLAFGTTVRVTNLKNQKTVTVRINDRGPFVRGRIIDLSRAAAEKIDMIRDGVVPVKIEVLE